jgi:hypothetical protein
MKQNYLDMGLSFPMGPELRKEVERQLLIDLSKYNVLNTNIKFDWSDSCIEGHSATYLDGSLQNYSGIQVYDENGDYIGDGWMEFILEKVEDLFIVYWEFLDIIDNGKEIGLKETPGIPDHIYELLPQKFRSKYANERV